MEKILIENQTNTGGSAYVKVVFDENDKITKIIAESIGDGWCGFSVNNPTFELSYGHNEYKELIIDGDYYLVDGDLPENFLSITLWQ